MNQAPLFVTWPSGDVDPWLAGHREALLQLGLTVVTDAALQGRDGATDVRVLPAWTFDDPRRYRDEYARDSCPTLLLAPSTDDVEALLLLARDIDEVGHAAEPVAVLVRRVRRLAGRAETLRRLGSNLDRDALTRLWNRPRFKEEIDRLVEAPTPTSGAAALLLIDIDHFKRLNDRYGHQMGDLALRRVAAVLQRQAQATDVVARYGGEEFALIVRRSDPMAVLAAAETLRQCISEINLATPDAGSEPVALTASFGVALHCAGLTAGEWAQRADMALYQAKAEGRNRVIAYESLTSHDDINPQDLKVRHFQNVTRVVTERVASLISLMGQQIVGAVQREANQDALTGVHNRGYFDRRLARELELALKGERRLSIAFIDIDEFGAFNRNFGAPTGDAVLRQFAAVVAEAIRPVDWLARYGGEEFCVVLPAALDDAVAVAERIRTRVAAAPLQTFDGSTVNITVSVGVAEYRTGSEDPVALVQRASKALQQAKRQGRNRVVAAP